MPRIPFIIRTIPFVTERGIAVPARRPFLMTQFAGSQGQRLPYPAFLDTGSPYSVIPHRLASLVPWNDLGAQVIVAATAHPVEWNGIPCHLGELSVELIDPRTQVRTRSLRVVAKIASQPAAPHLEQAALLGMSFLTDNQLREELDATGKAACGFVWVP